MEKNILALGSNNARPNPDLAGHHAKDTYFQNVYFELFEDQQTKTQQVFAIKRPGVNPTVAATGTAGAGTGLGCFTAQNYMGSNIYFGIDEGTFNRVYHFNGISTVTQVLASVPNPNDYYSRIRFNNVGLPTDFANVSVVTGSTVSFIKGTASTGTYVPGLSAPWNVNAKLTNAVYLNNRVFVGVVEDPINAYDGMIMQSNLGFTSMATASSETITVESYGGKLVELARYNNFIVAFKEYSTEFFEDVANQNGSVLGRVGQAIQQVGCVNPMTIVDTGGGELIWLANDEGQNHKVVKLTNSFNVEDITDPYVAKYLNLVHSYDGSFAYNLNANGHQFYILTLKDIYTTTTGLTNITLVYDLKYKVWTIWNATGENTAFGSGGFTYATMGTWPCSGACRSFYNTTYVQDIATGRLHQLDDAFYQDFPQSGQARPMSVIMQFANIDLDTFKRKFINRISILSDVANASSNSIDIQLVPVDGGNIANVRNLQTTTNAPFEWSSYAFGCFKRATLTLTHRANAPLRISAINMDFDIGEGYGIS